MVRFAGKFLFLFSFFLICGNSVAALIENEGVITVFPSVPQKNLKLGLVDIGFSYRFYSLGVGTRIKWPYYVIGIYNAEIKIVQELEIFPERLTMFSASLEGIIDESDEFFRNYSIPNVDINPPTSTVFLCLAQEIIPYNTLTFGVSLKISSSAGRNENFIGGFLYSEFLFFDENFYLPFYFEFLTKLDTQESEIYFYSNFVKSPMYSFGITASFWNSLFNVQLGIIYPGTKLEIKELRIELPVIPYVNLYFLL